MIGDTGRVATANPFAPDCEALEEVPMVDAVVLLHKCPFTGTKHLLSFWNVLHVPSVNNSSIPPFISQEAGITVNNVPKIHGAHPHHCFKGW